MNVMNVMNVMNLRYVEPSDLGAHAFLCEWKAHGERSFKKEKKRRYAFVGSALQWSMSAVLNCSTLLIF
jgi:hypothetical protein